MAVLHSTPSAQDIRDSALHDFRRFVNKRYDLNLAEGDYWALHKWSTSTPENINDYWNAVWDWTGIIGDKGAQPLFDVTLPMWEVKNMAKNARLNYAENMLLAHKSARSKTKKAIICAVEPAVGPPAQDRLASAHIRDLTYDQLYIEVAQAASALKKLGLKQGDRVAGLTPNNAEAVIVLLAGTSIGAIWSSSPPEFGTSAITDRFTQLRPKILLSADQYRASGKDNDIGPKLAEVVEQLRPLGLEHVIIVGQLENDRRPKGKLPSFGKIKSTAYPDFLDRSATEIQFNRVPAQSPLWVLYSSGTTGKPKAIIHSHLGMSLEQKKSSTLHSGLDDRDVHFQITTTGWMMWNANVSHLGIGATIVTYDGSPIYPTKSSLFDLIDAYGVTSFSLSPRYLQLLLQDGLKPRETHKLTSLKTIFSAGSPLKPELYEFFRRDIKDVFIHNGSGGTDVCAGFIGAIPILPVYQGVIQGPMLGVAAECFDENGNPYTNGEEGDLVLTRPLPNMPIGFLGDDVSDTKLRETYFTHFPKKTAWYQADYMQVNPKTGGITMLGRSDGVLNPQGVRFGSAELYAIVEEMKEEVDDCIAIGQKLGDGDERVVLFVKPMGGKALSQGLVNKIKDAIRTKLSKRHVPAKIIECQDIPYTVNGKRVEVAVKKVVNGAKPSSLNTSGMLNPQSLDFFINHPDLRLPSSATPLKAKL